MWGPDREDHRAGPPAGSELRRLGGKAHLLPLTLRSGSGSLPLVLAAARPPRKGSAQLLATEAPLYFVLAPRHQEPSRHVSPGSLADRWLSSSSATVPDTSFSTTCFAGVFRFLLQLLRWWVGPLLPLGQRRDRWRTPLELLTQLLETISGFS